MEKALGYRLMDSIKEITEFEMSEEALLSAIYIRKVDGLINDGLESIESSLKSQASVYGVGYEKYSSRVDDIKEKYLSEVNKLKEEYSFQFVNLQLELRETLANQKIAVVNAKKISDMKNEFINTEKYKEYLSLKNKLETSLNNAMKKEDYDKYYNLLENLENPLDAYTKKKKQALKKYVDLNSLVESCETKLKYCMNETYAQIEKIIKDNVEDSLAVAKENPVTKIINKVVNIFAGKSKFEGKVQKVEKNMDTLVSNNVSKVEEIRNNTIQLVAEIQEEKESLNSSIAA